MSFAWMETLGNADKHALYTALGRLGMEERSLIDSLLHHFPAPGLARGEYLLRGGDRAIWGGVFVRGLLP